MTLAEKLLCLFGKHDWLVDNKELRFDLTPNNPAAVAVMAGALLSSGSVVVTGLLIPAIGIKAFTIALGCLLGFILLIIYFTKIEYRMDAWCLRCNKQRLELTKHKEAKQLAKEFFKNLKELQ